MKSIIILRHGQAEPWSASGDHGRALTTQGVQDARRVGQFLANSNQIPQAVMVSSAKRAMETFDAVREGSGLTVEPWVSDALYMTNPEKVLELIHDVEPAVERLLLVGHQPTWGALLSKLVGGCQFNLPPAGCGCVQFLDDRWDQIQMSQGWLMWFNAPEHLDAV